MATTNPDPEELRPSEELRVALERNLRGYPRYQIARSLTFWLPVFFLYFAQQCSAAEVLRLEALYYIAVVALEVPSGYASDRWGRRPTLIVAAVAWTLGYLALGVGGSFSVLALGQVLIAAGMAFNSGTDGALLFDTLHALGRGDELSAREGRAQSGALLTMGMAALVGGLWGSVDLGVAYVLSAFGAAIAVGLAARFVEPPAAEAVSKPLRQLGAVASSIRNPTLSWVFAFAVAMTVFNHVPYELAQPYIALVTGEPAQQPVVSAVLMAAMLVVAAGASRMSARAAQWAGPATVLLGALLLQACVVGALSMWVHPAVLLVLLLRSAPGALSGPLMLQLTLPRLDAKLRATYLSVQSLAGRLAFAAALVASSLWIGEASALGAAQVSQLAFATLLLMGLVAVPLWLMRERLTSTPVPDKAPPAEPPGA